MGEWGENSAWYVEGEGCAGAEPPGVWKAHQCLATDIPSHGKEVCSSPTSSWVTHLAANANLSLHPVFYAQGKLLNTLCSASSVKSATCLQNLKGMSKTDLHKVVFHSGAFLPLFGFCVADELFSKQLAVLRKLL